MAWVIYNERVGAYYHPGNQQGAYATRERAAVWEDIGEAGYVADQLNETVIHGGEVLRDDGWVVVPSG